jgi:hypothetical protein
MPASKKKIEAERPQENNGEVPTVPAPEPGADGQPTEPETPTTRTPKWTTLRLLERAKKKVEIVREGKGKTRQPDISLRWTPIPDCPFRVWPDEGDYSDVFYVLRKTKGEKTKSIKVIAPDVVEGDIYVRRCIVEVHLVPCLEGTGGVYIWSQPVLDPTHSNYKMQRNLETVRAAAVKEWTILHWLDGFKMQIEALEYQNLDADWPTGQSPGEWQELAIEPYWVDDPDDPDILECHTKKRRIL